MAQRPQREEVNKLHEAEGGEPETDAEDPSDVREEIDESEPLPPFQAEKVG